MAATFTRLLITLEEEQCMVDWRLMPLRKNEKWWKKNRDCKGLGLLAAFPSWKDKDTWAIYKAQGYVT